MNAYEGMIKQLETTNKYLTDRIAKLEKEIQNMHMDAVVKVGQEIDAMPQTDVASIRDFVNENQLDLLN